MTPQRLKVDRSDAGATERGSAEMVPTNGRCPER